MIWINKERYICGDAEDETKDAKRWNSDDDGDGKTKKRRTKQLKEKRRDHDAAEE